jgi:hypothetical protein
MGEIKSTLELAMERTKNLVMTPEERQEMARREDETRVRAAVRKLLDGELRPAELAEQVAHLQRDRPEFSGRDAAYRSIAKALVPGENEGITLEALQALGFPRFDDLEKLVRETIAEADQLDAEASERLLGNLAAGGIRGSAVVPNPETDFVWQQERTVLFDGFTVQRDRLTP